MVPARLQANSVAHHGISARDKAFAAVAALRKYQAPLRYKRSQRETLLHFAAPQMMVPATNVETGLCCQGQSEADRIPGDAQEFLAVIRRDPDCLVNRFTCSGTPIPISRTTSEWARKRSYPESLRCHLPRAGHYYGFRPHSRPMDRRGEFHDRSRR